MAAAANTAEHHRPTAGQRGLSLCQDAALVLLSGVFFYAHARKVIEDGNLVNVGFALDQLILIAMFLTRRRARVVSRRPWDWVVAIGGWLPLLVRPTDADGMSQVIGGTLQVMGALLVVVGMCYLGRSFGVVAANRGLKINGPYRFVRHPVYAAHAIALCGFVVANPTVWNAAILVANLTLQVLRIRAEERLLTESAEYGEYRARVRWRVVPGVY